MKILNIIKNIFFPPKASAMKPEVEELFKRFSPNHPKELTYAVCSAAKAQMTEKQWKRLSPLFLVLMASITAALLNNRFPEFKQLALAKRFNYKKILQLLQSGSTHVIASIKVDDRRAWIKVRNDGAGTFLLPNKEAAVNFDLGAKEDPVEFCRVAWKKAYDRAAGDPEYREWLKGWNF